MGYRASRNRPRPRARFPSAPARPGINPERAASKQMAMPDPSADLSPLPEPVTPARISKEDINLLPLGSLEGPVVVVQSGDDLEPALARLASADLLGFDTETRPAFRKGQSFPPSLLQLATADEVFLFQLNRVGLPGGLNGRQVADAARALKPELKVLFITGYAENAVLNHGHIEHGMEVLTKPFAVGDLAGRVDRMLREA